MWIIANKEKLAPEMYDCMMIGKSQSTVHADGQVTQNGRMTNNSTCGILGCQPVFLHYINFTFPQ